MIARGILRRAAVAALTGLAVITVTQAMGAFNGLSLAILIGGALAVLSMPISRQAARRRTAEREFSVPVPRSPKPPHPRDCA